MCTQHIYVPFQLAEGREIKDPFPYSGEAAGYVAELKRNEPYYTIELSGIPSEQEASTQFKKLIVALYWVAVEMRFGILVQTDLQKVLYPPDPTQAAKNIFGNDTGRRADVVIDGGSPAIWLDGKEVVKTTGQPVGLIMSYNPSRFFDALNEGMKLADPDAILKAAKLKLGIDLYCLSHFRASDFARFLVLWTALETAAPSPSLPEPFIALIDKWINEIRQAQSNVMDNNSEEADLFKSLASSLDYLKNKSHGIRIRQYVRAMLEFDGDTDAEKLAREVSELYKLRGGLSHSGKYNRLGDGLSRMDEIVCKTFKAAMRHAAHNSAGSA